jgi:vacuolar-type H+-ATPase subunit H
LEAKGEQLLQDLVNQEKAITAKVDSSKEQAAKLVADAHAEAASLKSAATQKAEALYKEVMQKATADADVAKNELLAKAKQEASMIEQLAKNNMDKAVKMVLERVLP